MSPGDDRFVHVKLSSLVNNSPQTNEVFRTKVSFSTKTPTFGAFYRNKKIIFGPSRGNNSFAIYNSHENYLEKKLPCMELQNIDEFNSGKYLEILFVLDQNGIFTVIIYGSKHIHVLNCNTDFKYYPQETLLYIGYSDRIEDALPFIYDCPLEIAQIIKAVNPPKEEDRGQNQGNTTVSTEAPPEETKKRQINTTISTAVPEVSKATEAIKT
uniref:Uncharacterized protein n=1 Tax=Megaselia scalaris TaxID=36166 RepID=T1GL70_MEGSC